MRVRPQERPIRAGDGQMANYEVSALNATPIRVPTGAVAIITSSGTVGVCITEENG
jgi:hypothetical protein